MKNIILLLVIISISTGCRSEEYYKIINDNHTYSKKEFTKYLEKSNMALPEDYSQTPVIYNKLVKGDSIVNYVSFKKIWWGEKEIDPKSFEIVYKQDSAYLFLDRKLPFFNLPDLNGDPITSDQLSGKPTLIIFWNTKCGACIAEIPELNSLVEKYRDEVNFIAISLDDAASVKNFLTKRPFNFRHIPEAYDYIIKELMIRGFPLSYFLDRNGYVAEIKITMPMESNILSASTTPKLSNREFDRILERLTKL